MGQKHVLSGTYDGSTIRIFQDGVLRASAPLSGPVAPFSTVQIGRWDGSFNGTLDDVAVWNTALSSSQVAATAAHPPTGHQSGSSACGDSTRRPARRSATRADPGATGSSATTRRPIRPIRPASRRPADP